MERVAIFFAVLVALVVMPLSHAGTVLAQPISPKQTGPGEEFAESAFGQPPARIDLGVTPGYASRAVDELESDEYVADGAGESRAAGGRKPAGLQFAENSAKRVHHAKVKTPEAKDNSRVLIESVHSGSSGREQLSNATKNGVQEVALIASDLGFFPKTIFVSRDVPVRMFVTGASKNTLCMMMDSFQVRKQVRSRNIEEITFTPNVPGKYRFYCPINGMEGTMIVKELSTDVAQENPIGDKTATLAGVRE